MNASAQPTPLHVATATDVDESLGANAAPVGELTASEAPGLAQLRFEDLFDLAEIQALQDAFADANGVASLITRVDGTPITQPSRFCRLCGLIRATEAGAAACRRSDANLGRPHPRGSVVQPCLSGGLWDGGTSIFVGDRHIANWLIGQVKDESIVDSRVVDYARGLGIDAEEARRAVAEVAPMSHAHFESVGLLLSLMARQLSAQAVRIVQQARELNARRKVEAERESLHVEIRRLNEFVVASQEDERRRLSLALHDGAGQLLSTLAMRIRDAELSTGEAETTRKLGDMSSLVDSTLEEIRRISRALRPAALDLGLGAALRELAESTVSSLLQVRFEDHTLGAMTPECAIPPTAPAPIPPRPMARPAMTRTPVPRPIPANPVSVLARP